MDGKINRPYERKYWSSLMYINCAGATRLTPSSVSAAPAGDLHALSWTSKEVGGLPASFNALVGYYDIHNPKAVHFTDGGPWLEGYEDTPYADEWNALYETTRRSIQLPRT
jgi:hypothetical protein